MCRLWLLVLLLSFLLSPSWATTVVPPDFTTMVKRAEIIFSGQVTDVRSQWLGEGSQRCIVTKVSLTVLKTLKGSASSPYVLQTLGGTVDNRTMEVDGVPQFKVGDRTLLFVEHNGTQICPLVGFMHGYFRIATDTKSSQEIILRYNGEPLRSTTEIDQIHQQAVASSGTQLETSEIVGPPMKRADFEAEIQRKVSAGL